MGVFPSASAWPSTLDDLLAKGVWKRVFPAGESVGGPEGSPPAAPVFKGGAKVGYVFLTTDAVKTLGYSGKPIETLVGLGLDGKITGAKVIKHHEPILILGIPDSDLDKFLLNYKGMDIGATVRIGKPGKGEFGVDGISGASITSLVFNDGVLRSARMIARNRGIVSELEASNATPLDLDFFEEKDWRSLLFIGGLSHGDRRG